jgi:hypothetical protein
MKISIANFIVLVLLWATIVIAAPSGMSSTISPNMIDGADLKIGNVHITGVSFRSEDPNSPVALLGINCRGSAGCGTLCDAQIETLKAYVDNIGTRSPSLPSLRTRSNISDR